MADSVAGDHAPPDPSRRDFIHIAAITAAAGGVAAIAWPFVDQMNPASDTLALSSIEYDVAKVALGQQITVLYRKSPVGSSRVDLQACKLEYSIVSPK